MNRQDEVNTPERNMNMLLSELTRMTFSQTLTKSEGKENRFQQSKTAAQLQTCDVLNDGKQHKDN